MTASPPENTMLSDPAQWVELYGDYLFRYALIHLKDRSEAEDVVQETFLSAISAREGFSGKSSEKTWLTGILKNKVIDVFRKRKRVKPDECIEETAAGSEAYFDEKGFWKITPCDWGNHPLQSLEQKQFWEILRSCLHHLPEIMQEAFFLGEINEYSGQGICKVLEISSSNYWVLLHRARLKLRSCLEVNWFVPEKNK